MSTKRKSFCRLINATPFQWSLKKETVGEGQWADNAAPPTRIAPGEAVSFDTKRSSDGQWAAATVTYEIQDGISTSAEVDVTFLLKSGHMNFSVPDGWASAKVTRYEDGNVNQYAWNVVALPKDGEEGFFPTAAQTATVALFKADPLGLGEAAPAFDDDAIVETYSTLPANYVNFGLLPDSLTYASIVAEESTEDGDFDTWIFSNGGTQATTTTYKLERSSMSSFTFGFNQSFTVTASVSVEVGLPGVGGVSTSIGLGLEVGANQEVSSSEQVTWTNEVSAEVAAGSTVTFVSTLINVVYTAEFEATLRASLDADTLPDDEQVRTMAFDCVPALEAMKIGLTGTLVASDGEMVTTELEVSEDLETARARRVQRRKDRIARA